MTFHMNFFLLSAFGKLNTEQYPDINTVEMVRKKAALSEKREKNPILQLLLEC